MARMLGRYLTGGCWTGPKGSWRRCVPPGPDCSGHQSDRRKRKRTEGRDVEREIREEAPGPSWWDNPGRDGVTPE